MPAGLHKKPTIVAIAIYVEGTGMTRVAQRILGALQNDYDIHYVGLASGGDPFDAGMKIYPAGIDGRDVFGAYQAQELLEQLQPEIVFIHHDIWHFERYLDILAPVKGSARLVGYIPIDGDVTDETLAGPLRGLDRVVVYTDYARQELLEAFGQLRSSDGGVHPPVDVVGHGVDTEVFHPCEALRQAGFHRRGRFEAKRRVFPNVPDLQDSFVVLNASRPTPRKRVDLTIEGFGLFARNAPPNVRLCLHQAISDNQHAEDALALAQHCGIADRLHLNPLNKQGGPLSDQQMNLLYNACDVGINTSTGEGWGLVSFEHAAAGGAQIVPRHSACEDLWRGHAELIEPARSLIPNYSLLRMHEVSPQGIAEALKHLYRDRDLLTQRSAQAHQNATRAEYGWSPIAAQWRRLFREEIGQR